MIKKLICQNKQETSERNSLTVKDKIAMKKHYSKKLLFYKEQDLKKWNLSPNKLTNKLQQTKFDNKAYNYKKRRSRNRRRLEKNRQETN